MNLPEFIQEGIACVEQIERIDENYSFSYAFDLVRGLDRWMNVSECKEFLQTTDLRYMEVFCSLKRK